MQVFIHKDKQASLRPLKNMVKKRLPYATFDTETTDFSEAPWEEYNNNKKGIAKNWLYKKLDKLDDYYNGTLDFYFALVKAKHWGEPKVYGWHLGAARNDTRVCLIKHRRGYEKTVDHELAHATWRYIHIYTGINLETVLGVSEYDAIHGNDEYEEYDYDWYWDAIEPYLKLAHGEDNADEYRNLLELAVRRAQMVIRNLRS